MKELCLTHQIPKFDRQINNQAQMIIILFIQRFYETIQKVQQVFSNQVKMAALTQEEIQDRHRPLEFTYRDYVRNNRNLQNIKIQQYCFLQQIGEGAFAQVYKASNEQTNKLVAIKVLDLRNIQSQQSIRIKAIRKRLAKQQSKIMMRFNSPNLLKCYECLQNRDLKFMIIEYCSEGSLQEKIDTMKRIPEFQAISILKQIINGIGQCHKQKIIHRDLKADNILCNNGEYKIADFGFSKELRISTEEELSRNTCLGTMTTMAPQVLKRQNYGLKADIWSIGVIFFQMIFGQCPFKSNTSAEMITEIMSNKLLKEEEYKGVKASPQARKFIREVLVVDINKRLGWRELLEHEIFKVKPESLPATFNRRIQIKERDQQLEDIERDFVKTSNNENSSLLNNSFSQQSESRPQDPFNQKQTKLNQSPKREVENFSKKKVEQKPEEPVYKLQYPPPQKPYQEIPREDKSKNQNEQTEYKLPSQDIHRSLQEKNQNSAKKIQEDETTFKRLNPQEILDIKQKINQEDVQIYKWAKKIHVECLKTECIFNNIIKPIQKHNLLDLDNRRNIQMMYLIATRCMNNISPINFEYEKRKNNPIIQDIHYGVQRLYKDVVSTWLIYSRLLTEKQNQKMVIFKDWFSKKLSKQEMKIKDKFLSGVQNMTEFRPQGSEEKKVNASKLKEEDLKDYDKEEQIEFTNNYINEVLKDLKPTNWVKDVKNYLIHYKDICGIQAADLKTRQFNEHLHFVLL